MQTKSTQLSKQGSTLQRITNGELSVYSDQQADKTDVATAIGKLRAVFPKQTNEFFAVLAEMVVNSGMTANQLKDAVNHAICNTKYELKVSDIMTFDKRVKLYSYEDVYRMTGKFPSPDYCLVIVNGQRMYAKLTDAQQCGIRIDKIYG
jgi:hypothetical protein